jgi:hypothetical protein
MWEPSNKTMLWNTGKGILDRKIHTFTSSAVHSKESTSHHLTSLTFQCLPFSNLPFKEEGVGTTKYVKFSISLPEINAT